jgi:hypothetical protein
MQRVVLALSLIALQAAPAWAGGLEALNARHGFQAWKLGAPPPKGLKLLEGRVANVPAKLGNMAVNVRLLYQHGRLYKIEVAYPPRTPAGADADAYVYAEMVGRFGLPDQYGAVESWAAADLVLVHQPHIHKFSYVAR